MPQEKSPRPGPTQPHILLTGVTGFVGQALLERLLSSTDARVSVIVRPRGSRSGQDRLDALFDKPVFDPWRSRVGRRAARRDWAQRVTVLDGDLRDVPDLPDDLDGVLHSASSVSFDDPIDAAFATNVGGPYALYSALSRAGGRTLDAHVVHVSTSYVGTGRHEIAPERSVDHAVHWRAELAAALEAPARLAREHESQRELKAALRRAGRRRAHELGWTDVYTMTKALGERVAEDLWAGAGRPLTILRPTIIESALRYPYPGWIDGFKVADPLIAAYAQGRLVGFPGRPDSVLDVIPVDFVVNAALAALRTPPAAPAYLQVGSGTTNPLTLAELRRWVQAFFSAHPWIDKDGNEIHPASWEFSDPSALDRWTCRRERALHASRALLDLMPAGWFTGSRESVRSGLRRLETMRGFVELYQPYTCATTTYDDTNTRDLLALQRHPRDTFDVTAIDWRRYLTQAHLPALVAIMEGRTNPAARPASVHSMHDTRRAARRAHAHGAHGGHGGHGAHGSRVHALGA